MNKGLKRVLCMALASCMLLSACSSKDASSGGSTAPSGADGVKLKDTLVIAAGTEPKTLDAHGANDTGSSIYKSQIYDTVLAQNEETMEIIPAIAEKWEYVDDTTLKLTIRQGVKFHNGEALTASDVMYSIKRASESEFTAWMTDVVDIANSKAVDDTTVELKLQFPSGALLSQLCFLYVVDEKTVTEMGDEKFNENPIGSGPFVYKQWVRGDRVEFERFDDYWNRKPAYSKLIIRVIGEISNRAIEVESGGVDIAIKIGTNDIANLESNPNAKIVRQMGFGQTWVGFNCTVAPFDNKLVRQAISYAVDRESIVKAVFGGTGSVSTGPISPAIWGYSADVPKYEYDPAKAKQLLADAGYPNGLDIVITSSDSQQRMDIAEIMQNQLKEAGINMKVESFENSTYLDKIIEGSFQMYILGWTTTTGDAHYGLYEPFKTGGPTWSNTARYSNPAVDKLLDVGQQSTDQEARKAAYAEAQKLIVEDAPWIFLWDSEEVDATTSKVTGYRNSPTGRYDLTGITVAA